MKICHGFRLRQRQAGNTYKYTGLIASRKYKIMVKATDKNGNTDETEQEIQTKANNNSIVGIITSDEIDSSRSIIKDAGGINYGFEITYLDKNNLPEQVTYDSSTNTYTIEDDMEIGTATNSQMAVLKCDGNLKINRLVTITTSTYEVTVPTTGNVTKKKGLFICCMGVLTNKGTISQTARGAYQASSENVYLWKNENGSYEYVPYAGGTGGNRRSDNNKRGVDGQAGKNGIEVGKRATGGGGSGAAFDGRDNAWAQSGAGSSGNSYSGGKGGGGAHSNSGYYTEGKNAESDAGGKGGGLAGGGAGNPGGKWGNSNEGANGDTGTGGLLIVYAEALINNGTIEANGMEGGSALYAPGGSSGGGSINIFSNKVLVSGTTSAVGGEREITWVNNAGNSVSNAAGGKGGDGTVTSTRLIMKTNEEMLKLYEQSIMNELSFLKNEKVFEYKLKGWLEGVLPTYGTIEYDKNGKITGVNTEYGKIDLKEYYNGKISDTMKLSLATMYGDYVEYQGSSDKWRALGANKIVRDYDSTLRCSREDFGCLTVRKFIKYLEEKSNWTEYVDTNVAISARGTLYERENESEIGIFSDYWVIKNDGNYVGYLRRQSKNHWVVQRVGSETASYGLRPVVNLKEDLMTDGKNANGAWRIIRP